MAMSHLTEAGQAALAEKGKILVAVLQGDPSHHGEVSMTVLVQRNPSGRMGAVNGVTVGDNSVNDVWRRVMDFVA